MFSPAKPQESPGFFRATVYGIVATLLALPLASHFFVESKDLAASALVALLLTRVLESILNENKENIWKRDCTAFAANSLTAIQFGAIFFGVFIATFLFAAMGDKTFLLEQNFVERFKSPLGPLSLHNGRVLAAAFLFSIPYQAGGLVFILSWNALHWATSFASYAVYAGKLGGGSMSVVMVGSLAPHLFLETVGYVVGGLAGAFLGRGLTKYSLLSEELRRVINAVLVLIFIAAILMSLAAVVEVYFAQRMYHWVLSTS